MPLSLSSPGLSPRRFDTLVSWPKAEPAHKRKTAIGTNRFMMMYPVCLFVCLGLFISQNVLQNCERSKCCKHVVVLIVQSSTELFVEVPSCSHPSGDRDATAKIGNVDVSGSNVTILSNCLDSKGSEPRYSRYICRSRDNCRDSNDRERT